MDFAQVTCPTCCEVFEVAVPHPDELPAEVDYDCEVCCRPMVIVFSEDASGRWLTAHAIGARRRAKAIPVFLLHQGWLQVKGLPEFWLPDLSRPNSFLDRWSRGSRELWGASSLWS